MLLLLTLACQEPIGIPDGMLQPAMAVTESRKAAEDAQVAWDAGETASALGLFRTAAQLRPMHGGLLIQQARAAAQAGEKTEALLALQRAATMGFGFELGADEALASLREDEAFTKLLSRLEANRKPLVRSEVAFRASLGAEEPLYAEGIAHDAATGDFYLSSFGYSQIARVRRVAGKWSAESFTTLKPWMTYGCYGMLWHDDHLHVGTGGPFGKRHSRSPIHFVARPDLDATDFGRSFYYGGTLGDLCATGRGEEFAFSDPLNSTVVVQVLGEEFRTLIPTGVLPNPQGIVCFQGEAPLIVLADYAAGVFAFPLDAPQKLRELKGPTDACLLGIDGLVRHGNDLLAIQNGIGVYRVLRLCLDEERERITKVEVLERNHPEHGEPTLGVVVGDDLYYVANAPWGLTAEDEPPPAVVLRLPLKE